MNTPVVTITEVGLQQLLLRCLETANIHDTNTDGFVSWEEIFVAVKARTEKIFSIRKNDLPDRWKGILEDVGQESQRPKYFGRAAAAGRLILLSTQLGRGNI